MAVKTDVYMARTDLWVVINDLQMVRIHDLYVVKTDISDIWALRTSLWVVRTNLQTVRTEV